MIRLPASALSMPVVASALLSALFTATPASAMTASFTWAGIPACSATSPAFRIAAAPKGTVRLRFALRDYHAPNFNHGGSTVDYDGKGQVARGAISYIGPCPPPGPKHRYIWTIDALDATGKKLDTTEAEGLYP